MRQSRREWIISSPAAVNTHSCVLLWVCYQSRILCLNTMYGRETPIIDQYWLQLFSLCVQSTINYYSILRPCSLHQDFDWLKLLVVILFWQNETTYFSKVQKNRTLLFQLTSTSRNINNTSTSPLFAFKHRSSLQISVLTYYRNDAALIIRKKNESAPTCWSFFCFFKSAAGAGCAHSIHPLCV